MYQCESCGGNLRFDIDSQQLVCDYCKMGYPVGDVAKKQDAEQEEVYDVTVFRCPQCGGEIYSVDTTAAGFCSYCGASTILQSRLEKENKVQYIIPFKKTKEDCKKEYLKLAKRAIFAPKELKKKEYIEEFRGIYMPYWMYDVSQKDNIHFPGTRTHRSGDYIITDHYDISMDIDMNYSGLNYDGAASFADDISSRLAPFSIAEKQEFLPGYLCGFYADMSDVDKRVYVSDVKQFAADASSGVIKRRAELGKYTIRETDIKRKLSAQVEGIQSAMFPVWFLAYRNRDRVAYATVNGQTGKVVADMPVDIKKYFIGTAILSVPLFMLLNLFFTVVPSVLIWIVSGIALLTGFLHRMEMRQIAVAEGDLEDKGKIFQRDKQEQERRQKRAADEKKKKTLSSDGFMIGLVFVVIIGISIMTDMNSGSYGMQMIFVIIMFIITLYLGRDSHKNALLVKGKKQKYGGYFCAAAIGLTLVILFLRPVEDYWYYLGAAAAMTAIAASLVDLIFGYNLLATRRLILFDHKGGDDRA